MIKKAKIRLALLETGGSHGEILITQSLFLDDPQIIPYLIIRKNQLKNSPGLHKIKNILTLEEDKNSLGRILQLRKIRSYLKKNHIKYLVINTAQGAFIRDLCMQLPPRLNITGISHNPQKLNTSFTQKIINRRIKKYFVLSDPIKENLRPMNPDLQIESLYTVFSKNEPHPQPAYDTGNFLVCIPGAIESKRRNYQHLIDELTHKNDLYPGVTLVFLGRMVGAEAQEIKMKIEKLVGEERTLFFDSWIPEKDFSHYLFKSRIILPLIAPGNSSFELYRDFKLSGTINLSLGKKIPMLLHQSLNKNNDYLQVGFFYETGEMITKINQLAENPIQLINKQEDIKNIEKLNFDYQKEKYLSFVLK